MATLAAAQKKLGRVHLNHHECTNSGREGVCLDHIFTVHAWSDAFLFTIVRHADVSDPQHIVM